MSPFGPLFSRELSRIARRRRYYLLRAAIGCALLAVLTLTAARTPEGAPGDLKSQPRAATQLFTSWGLLGFAAMVLLTPFVVCGVVAEERSRGSLDLLFTTHLTNFELLAGKLGAALALLAMNYLATVPIVFFLGIFGGVDPYRLVLIVSLTLSAGVFSALLSVCFSIVCRDALAAFTRTWLSMAFVWIALPMLVQIGFIAWRVVARAGPPRVNIRLAFDLFSVTNAPACLIFSIGDWPIGWVPSPFDTWAFTLVAGGCLLAAGARRLRKVELRPAAPARPGLLRRAILRLAGPRLLDANPLLWRSLVLHRTSSRGGLFVCAWIAIGIFAAFFWIQPNYKPAWDWAVRLRIGSLILLQIAAGVGASIGVSRLRERGLLSFVALSSIPPSQTIFAAYIDALRSAAGLFLLLFAATTAWVMGLPGDLLQPWKIESAIRFLAPLFVLTLASAAGGVLVSAAARSTTQFFAAWSLTCLANICTLAYCSAADLPNRLPGAVDGFFDSLAPPALASLFAVALRRSPSALRPWCAAAFAALAPWAVVRVLVELPRLWAQSPFELRWITSASWWTRDAHIFSLGAAGVPAIGQFVVGNVVATLLFLMLATRLLRRTPPVG